MTPARLLSCVWHPPTFEHWTTGVTRAGLQSSSAVTQLRVDLPPSYGHDCDHLAVPALVD
eukprot:349589-Chlamydomonas_euryale.AAC.3